MLSSRVFDSGFPNPSDFLKTIESPFKRAYRLHPNRGRLKFGKTSPVPWNPSGIFLADTIPPSQWMEFHLGLLYPQDAASQLPAQILNPRPGEWVLDFCAAPGSKSTQMALMMNNSGHLILHDLSESRSRSLERNLELQGIYNHTILKAPFPQWSNQLQFVMDAVLVDAPCSGHQPTSQSASTKMGKRQLSILKKAAQCVKKGGRLVYSTCTPWVEENEDVIIKFLKQEPDFEIQNIQAPECDPDLKELGALRLWPQHQGTEPFFACCLIRKEGDSRHPSLLEPDPDSQALDGIEINSSDKDFLTFSDGRSWKLKHRDVPKLDLPRIQQGFYMGKSGTGFSNLPFIPTEAFSRLLLQWIKADEIWTRDEICSYLENPTKTMERDRFVQSEEGCPLGLVGVRSKPHIHNSSLIRSL